MAGKRTASNELNHDNWDDDDEADEMGTFKRAPDEIMKTRVIKTARRRNPISSANNESSAKNAFSTFGGFKKPESNPSQANSPFAFLANITTPVPTQSNNTNGLKSNLSISSSSTTSIIGSATSTLFKSPDCTSSANSNEKTDSLENSYYSKLKGLNESVSLWIKRHVDTNPFIILSPIFKDYEKYLAEIENSKNTAPAFAKIVSNTTSGFKVPNSTPMANTNKSSSHSASIFGSLSNKSNENPFLSSNKSVTEEKLKETNSGSSPATPPMTAPTFSFGSNVTSKLPTTPTTGFSFGSGTPFAFSNVSKPQTIDNTKTEAAPQEDEDEPPKVEFTPVVEDDNVFQKRCKVFVKKNDQFTDRGVGQLFLKPVEGSEKIQLIVRADTSLGNLLLNFILNTSIPVQRMGKNNVMLVSIPTPDSKPPPVPILLRVKTAEEADELLKVLEKLRK